MPAGPFLLLRPFLVLQTLEYSAPQHKNSVDISMDMSMDMSMDISIDITLSVDISMDMSMDISMDMSMDISMGIGNWCRFSFHVLQYTWQLS